MDDHYIEEYLQQIEKLQMKGGQLTHEEITLLDYCNKMVHDYGQEYLDARISRLEIEDFL